MLIDPASERALGPALAWANRAGVGELHLLVEDHAADLARRASAFSARPTVWQIEGRTLVAVGSGATS